VGCLGYFGWRVCFGREESLTQKKRPGAGKKPAPTGAKARAAAVKKILLAVEKKMEDKELKATLADYIRLIQLQKEMTPEMPSEITMTWVEPKK
jgi:hypothetical protein